MTNLGVPCSIQQLAVSYLVFNDNTFFHSQIKHLLVPVDKSLVFGNFLLQWMTMKDVVISFTGWASPDVSHLIPYNIKNNSFVEYIKQRVKDELISAVHIVPKLLSRKYIWLIITTIIIAHIP